MPDLTAMLDAVPAWAWAALVGIAALTAGALVAVAAWVGLRLARRPRTAPATGGALLTRNQRRAIAAVGLPAAVLAVYGFFLAFTTMEKRLKPTFADYAGHAVIVLDLSIAVSSATALLLVWLGIRISFVRFFPWLLIAASIALNISAGGTWWEKLAHSLMPMIYSFFVEVVILAASRKLKLSAGPGARPEWGARQLTLAWDTTCEKLAWTNWPRDPDITADLAGAVEHLRRVRAVKAERRAERAAAGGGWFPLMVASAHRDALSAMRAQLDAATSERNAAVGDLAAAVALVDEAGARHAAELARRETAEAALVVAESSAAAVAADRDAALAEAVANEERARLAEAVARAAEARILSPGGASKSAGKSAGKPAADSAGKPASKSELMRAHAREVLARGEDIEGGELARRFGAEPSVGRKALQAVRRERGELHLVSAGSAAGVGA